MYIDLTRENVYRREYFYSKNSAAQRSSEVKEWAIPDTDVYYDGKVYAFRYTNVNNLMEELEKLNDPENCNVVEYKTIVTF